MARRITGQDRGSLQDMLYTEPVAAVNYARRRFEEGGSSGEYSERFLSKVRKVYQASRDSRLYRSSLASSRKLRNRNRPDIFQQLLDIGAYQNAPTQMAKVIMSNPTFRRRYNKNMLAGYEETYRKRDAFRGYIEHTDPLYRNIMSGVAVKRDEGYTCSSYYMSENDRSRLTTEDRGDARVTWAIGDELLAAGNDDPTSQFNAALN